MATRAALDAAVAVRVAPHLAPLDAAEHAVLMARAALAEDDPAGTRQLVAVPGERLR